MDITKHITSTVITLSTQILMIDPNAPLLLTLPPNTHTTLSYGQVNGNFKALQFEPGVSLAEFHTNLTIRKKWLVSLNVDELVT